MGVRELLLFGHIGFAMIWVGSHICVQVLAMRVRGATPARTLEFVTDVEWLGRRLQGPAALMVLVFGILLVIQDEFSFMATWIVLALVGFAVLVVIAGGYLVPQTRRILALAEERGADAPEVQTRIKAVTRVARAEAVVMLAIILDMVVKPGL